MPRLPPWLWGLLLLLGSAVASAQERVWLEVVQPEEDLQTSGPLGLVEVNGWAGTGEPIAHDVVIVVDTSGSTALASGVDVDEDGKLGVERPQRDGWRNYNVRYLSSDPDDTILSAELMAAERLIDLLDRGRTRVGVISFSGHAELQADLESSPEELAAAILELEQKFGSGATNMADAIELSHELLQFGEWDGRPRRRSILLLSDGYPTEPQPPGEAIRATLSAAQAASSDDIRIHAYALGVQEPDGFEVYESLYATIARVTGGRHTRLDKPGEVVHALPQVNMSGLASIKVRNLTLDTPGQAVRVFPDGSFDGFVRVASGDNQIRITATGRGGGEIHVERVIRFERRRPADDAEAEAIQLRLERLRNKLRDRTLETRLALEIEAERERAHELWRDVEVEMERGESD
jgi:hypothetical protein